MTDAPAPMARPSSAAVPTTPAFWLTVVAVVLVDFATKVLAVQQLMPMHVPHPILGDVVRFTLAYNPGAAFGMHLGPASRWIFATLSVVIVTVLLRSTGDLVRTSRLAAIGVPVVIGGAIGNLVDRIRQSEGVVDFIDIGLGERRFWIFNVADSAVTVGAICLILALWQLERANERAAAAAGVDRRPTA